MVRDSFCLVAVTCEFLYLPDIIRGVAAMFGS
jgi:hypothetical protein